jgi:hypothetical protein
MIRLVVVLVSMMAVGFAHAGPMQALQQDTKFPSVLDLSDGKPAQWKVPEDSWDAPVYYGGSSSGPSSLSSGAPRTEPVRGYVRANGTYVAPYVRSSRRR